MTKNYTKTHQIAPLFKSFSIEHAIKPPSNADGFVSCLFDKCFISIVNTSFCIMYSVCVCSWWWDVYIL